VSITFDRDTLQDFERASRLEWLETDGMGGWAGSSVSGAHTRRYHGLLVAATRPPLGRKVLLSKLDETLHIGRESFELGTNRYRGEVVHPRGHRFLAGFTRDLFPVWEIETGPVRLEKTVAAVHGSIPGGGGTTLVLWEVVEAPEPFTLELQPFVAARDLHALTTANRYLKGDLDFTGGRLRLAPYPGMPEIHLLVPGAELDLHPDWYRSFEYDRERERGLDCQEDLWTPGFLRCELAPPPPPIPAVSTRGPCSRRRPGAASPCWRACPPATIVPVP
jgi:predicted glycogen debranching enzyme